MTETGPFGLGFLQDDASSDSVNLAFATWRGPGHDRLSLVTVDVLVSGTGATNGNVTIDVDETGDQVADWSIERTVQTGLTGSITVGELVTVPVPAGGNYQVRNVSDPNARNAIQTVREFLL